MTDSTDLQQPHEPDRLDTAAMGETEPVAEDVTGLDVIDKDEEAVVLHARKVTKRFGDFGWKRLERAR